MKQWLQRFVTETIRGAFKKFCNSTIKKNGNVTNCTLFFNIITTEFNAFATFFWQTVNFTKIEFFCLSLQPLQHITPLLRQLHRLKAAEQIDYKLALLIYKCRQGEAPPYLADKLCQPADTEAWCRLRSASASSLIVCHTRLSTVGDRAFPVAAPCIWNNLPQHVTSAPLLAIFRSRLKTHLFRRCFPRLHRCLVMPEKWHVITDMLIVFVT